MKHFQLAVGVYLPAAPVMVTEFGVEGEVSMTSGQLLRRLIALHLACRRLLLWVARKDSALTGSNLAL
jgi:hypothetical protein